ncbi:MAG TPA: hypothetical protein VFK50_00660 [Sphingomicrobium sp.]|nr:hypothetical protein [Sphingomicrobium sp.]
MRSLAALVSIALTAGTPAAGVVTETTPAASPPAENAKAEKVRCKRVDQTSAGSNLKKWTRVCKPVSGWNPDRIAFEQSLDEMKDRGLVDSNALMQSGAPPR